MSYFNVLGIINEGLYSLTGTLYNFLGSLYTFIVGLATTDFFKTSTIDDFTRTIYVLAGVFMLFRIAVSFLNTLIDPDKLTDKNEGAGNILKRLVIVVLLMVALVPNSYVYKFLDRLELAIIGEDGLIENLVDSSNISTGSAVNKYINDINPFEGTYKKVDAITEDWDKLPLKSIVKNGSGVCYKLTAYGSSGSNPVFTKVNSCGNDYWTIKGGYCSQTYTTSNAKADLTRYPATLVKGSKELKNVLVTNAICEGKQVDDSFKNSGAVTNIDGSSSSSKKATLDVGGKVAQGILNTMTSCPEVSDQTSSECMVDIKGNVLTNDEQAIDDIDDGKLSISWLIAIIVGIIIILYLAALCIEVVVRSLKILLLQMIAPVAIISYISPKDKVLGQWAKMYASTYLDLFLKLFAIKLGAELIGAITFSGRIIEDLILILGCLVFMKVIPTMISKIFGIDIAGGTFKDSFGMLKKGVGLAAGATIGGAAAGITGAMAFHATKGQGFGNRALAGLKSFSSVGSGLVSGASSGAKGKVTGGLGTSSKNLATKSNYDSGLTASSMLAGATIGKVGLDYASKIDKQNQAKRDKMKSLDDFTKFKGNIEDTAESGKFMKSARQKVSTGELTGVTENKLQDWRDTWAEYQYATTNTENKASLDRLLGDDRSSLDDIRNRKLSLEAARSSGNQAQITAAQQAYDRSLATYNVDSNMADLAMSIDNIERESGLRFEVEGGKQAGIADNMVKANMAIKGNADVRETTGDITLNTFSDLKENNTKVKKQVTAIGQEIFESEDDKYRLSKAAHDATGGKK